jgi:hypothetical protein
MKKNYFNYSIILVAVATVRKRKEVISPFRLVLLAIRTPAYEMTVQSNSEFSNQNVLV